MPQTQHGQFCVAPSHKVFQCCVVWASKWFWATATNLFQNARATLLQHLNNWKVPIFAECIAFLCLTISAESLDRMFGVWPPNKTWQTRHMESNPQERIEAVLNLVWLKQWSEQITLQLSLQQWEKVENHGNRGKLHRWEVAQCFWFTKTMKRGGCRSHSIWHLFLFAVAWEYEKLCMCMNTGSNNQEVAAHWRGDMLHVRDFLWVAYVRLPVHLSTVGIWMSCGIVHAARRMIICLFLFAATNFADGCVLKVN